MRCKQAFHSGIISPAAMAGIRKSRITTTWRWVSAMAFADCNYVHEYVYVQLVISFRCTVSAYMHTLHSSSSFKSLMCGHRVAVLLTYKTFSRADEQPFRSAPIFLLVASRFACCMDKFDLQRCSGEKSLMNGTDRRQFRIGTNGKALHVAACRQFVNIPGTAHSKASSTSRNCGQ